jgi:SAM-dependent methyltransferase
MRDKAEETKDYFDNNTEFWSSLFGGGIYGTATQRIRIVSNKIGDFLSGEISGKPKTECTHIDFGCGTGELATVTGSMGIQVIAIDIAPRMVSATKTAFDKEGLHNARAYQGGIDSLDDIETNSIDVFSALGLIEYLTLSELDIFLDSVARILRPSGRAYIGSRNRLFNIFSENDFTDLEVSLGEYNKLAAEAESIRQWIAKDSLITSLNDKKKIEKFTDWVYPDELPRTSPVSVSQRIQYSICDLSMRSINSWLTVNDIHAVRYHPAKMAILDTDIHSELIDKINLTIDDYGDTKWALPCSSTYILELSK